MAWRTTKGALVHNPPCVYSLYHTKKGWNTLSVQQACLTSPSLVTYSRFSRDTKFCSLARLHRELAK